MGNTVLDDEGVVAATMAAMPRVGSRRLCGLLVQRSPREVWEMLDADVRDTELVAKMADRLAETGIGVTYVGHESYPPALLGDGARPSVLFWRGDVKAVRYRRVGIVGTRSASAAGRYMASHLAFDLSMNGVATVSGLARGIDGWAHRGAMLAAQRSTSSAPPIAVVASGLDVIYPKEHAELWEWVATNGLLVSESPPGTMPEAYRFPLRNRILAALSEVLVVVESKAAGGSMITVEEAQKRDIAVMAVPGSPRTASAAGTNLLLQQGCAPVVSVDDVLVALGLDHRRAHPYIYDPRKTPTESDARVLAAIGSEALTLDQILVRVSGDMVATALALGRLEADGWLAQTAGWWEVLGRLPDERYG
jgi:DNA processing protein